MAQHPDADVLAALVLGRLDSVRAEGVAAHLVTCRTCRATFDRYADSIATLRSASPPAGLAPGTAKDAGGAGGPAPFPLGQRPPERRWLPWLRVAAALVVGLVLGGGAVLGWPKDEPVPAASPTPTWHAPLLTGAGQEVGTVARSTSAAGPVLVLEVTGGPAGKELTCRLVRAGGRTTDVAQVELSDQRPNSWVIEIGRPEPSQVQLVDQDGELWAAARPPATG